MEDSNQKFNDSLSGLKIGPYIMGRTIGKGNFGKVKYGIHHLTRLPVAIKIVNRQKIKNLDVVDKIRREIRFLQLFEHPHIIKLYQVISTPGDFFMVMEFVNGGELFEYIRAHPNMGEDQSRRFFQQIISGVGYCHRHMIVHRDLKPENLLLDRNLNVKIADFGLSNVVLDGEFLKTSCGSPNYAAPEIIAGLPYGGPEVDIWSCGVILFVMICGRLPFEDSQMNRLFSKIRNGAYMFPIDCDKENAKNLITLMLTVDSVHRPSITQITEHPWFAQDLPEYLFPTLDTFVDNDLDMGIVHKLASLFQVTEMELLKSLENIHNHDQLVVAYKLLKNNQTMTNAAVQWKSNLKTDEFSTPTNLSTRKFNKNTSGRRFRWHLGIRSQINPEVFFYDLLAALASLGLEWKFYELYHLRVRKKKSETNPKALKIHLKIYRLNDKNYILDFIHSVPAKTKRSHSGSHSPQLTDTTSTASDNSFSFKVHSQEQVTISPVSNVPSSPVTDDRSNPSVDSTNHIPTQFVSHDSDLSAVEFLNFCSQIITALAQPPS